MNNFLEKSNKTSIATGYAASYRHALRVMNIALVAGLGLQASSVLAQDTGAQSIKVGDSQITPTIRLDYVTVDNTFRTPDNEVDSTGLVVGPAVSWEANRRLLQISAGYRGSYGIYNESVLDFDDHSLGIRIDANPGSRHRVFAAFGVDRDHENLGTGQARFTNALDEQIESTTVAFRTGYTFGAQGAKGNLGVGLNVSSETFDNVDFLTDGDDNTLIRPFLRFSYRVSPDTRFIAEARYGAFDFDQDSRDRDEISLLGGLDLSATARTAGRIRLGVTRADFDFDNVSDTTVFIADVNVSYRPRSFSTINFSFNRDLSTVDNSTGNNSNESIVDRVTLSWNHQWSSRFSTVARYDFERFGRDCPLNSTDTNTFALEAGVNIRRWISVGVTGSNSQRTVDSCGGTLEEGAADFDVNQFGVFLRASL